MTSRWGKRKRRRRRERGLYFWFFRPVSVGVLIEPRRCLPHRIFIHRDVIVVGMVDGVLKGVRLHWRNRMFFKTVFVVAGKRTGPSTRNSSSYGR